MNQLSFLTTGATNALKCRNTERRVSAMRTITKAFTSLLWLFFFVFATQTARAQDENFPTGNGDGTADAPFQITSAEELAAMASLVNSDALVDEEAETPEYLYEYYRSAYYKLMNNIDLSVLDLTEDVDDGEGGIDIVGGWIPIGSSDRPFAGVFDGNGKTVTGLYIKQSGGNKGLFGRTSGTGAIIKNLGVTGEVINTVFAGNAWDENVGGIAGSVRLGGRIENCWFSGSVTGQKGTIGGIAGYLNPGTINKCWSDATVRNTGNANNGRLGGIVGAIEGQVSLVNNCFFSGTVAAFFQIEPTFVAAERTGGIVGHTNPGRVSNCYVTGDVRGGAWGTGGIVGFAQANTIVENCYITSAVDEQGSPRLGGIVGRANNNSVNLTIRNCIVLSPKVDGNVGNTARIHGDPALNGTGAYTPEGGEAISFDRFTYLNYAWEGVQNFEGSTDWGDCYINNRQGKSVTVREIRGADFFKNIFETAAFANEAEKTEGDAKWAGGPFASTWSEVLEGSWTFLGGELPSLMGETVPVPEHLYYTDAVLAPAITTQPAANPAVSVGDPITLRVVATSPDGGGLTYQWYSNATASNTGGVAIEGATGSSFDPDTETADVYYYYVVVTNNFRNGEELVGTPLASNVCTLTVTDQSTYLVTITSIGVAPTGGGTYLESATVEINAGADPKGYDFIRWNVNEGDVTLADPTSRITTFTMPPNPVKLTAQFDRITGSEDLKPNPLKAWTAGGVVNVSGLTEGKVWRIYNTSGAIVEQGIADSDTVKVNLENTGMYIIQSEGKTLKFVY